MIADHTPPLFYIRGEYDTGDIIVVSGNEAAHILQSRRMKPDDTIGLTNGMGIKALGRIKSVASKSKSLELEIVGFDMVPKSKHNIILTSAIAKGDRQSVLLNMTTQLGMSQYIPLLCDHSVVTYQEKMRERWSRVMIGACKQSRQCYFPTIRKEANLQTLLAEFHGSATCIVADASGKFVTQVQSECFKFAKEIILFVGPEGGFSKREQKMLLSGNVLKLKLGRQILRTETAAAAILAAMNQIL